MFKPHALLLRGGMLALWRMETQALKDLQELVNTPGLSKEVEEVKYIHVETKERMRIVTVLDHKYS